MSDKIIMLCIVLVAVAVIAAVFIRRAISYRRRVKETIGEGIPPEEISIGVTREDMPREKDNYYRSYFFHPVDSSTRNGRDVLIQPKHHARIKAIVGSARKKGIPVTIYSYMDNVLEHHFQSFGEDITDLHLNRDDSH
ncbi:DUF3408 domain-containing protein [Anaerorudis cellulosivorans]|jgi:hypothetical protein|uniref:DUF3408 domain-containing protein n=1 Tax=Anaerorudis cellulosivorans TaxID=3397862 RepID=UPI00222078C0|nr:DUF3408 domain-containing protein [Seramator thermalis]MCW1734588.1 DUF3408 domain-containing protein [Seramator thermalis]